jgi:hypothetical protein
LNTGSWLDLKQLNRQQSWATFGFCGLDQPIVQSARKGRSMVSDVEQQRILMAQAQNDPKRSLQDQKREESPALPEPKL